MDIDEILVALGVISQLKGNDKLGIVKYPGETQLVVDSGTSWIQGWHRWYYGTNRSDVLKYLWTLVQRCERAAQILSSSHTRALGASLRSEVTTAVIGLKHLRTTYSSDSNAVSQLSLVIAKFEDACTVLQALESP